MYHGVSSCVGMYVYQRTRDLDQPHRIDMKNYFVLQSTVAWRKSRGRAGDPHTASNLPTQINR